MKSFGRLQRQMRKTEPLSRLAERTTFDERYLAGIETGRIVPDEFVVRHILTKGFGLDRRAATEVVLGLQLYDLGLRDADLRLLVIDLITKAAPARVREQARRLYHSYTPR